MVFHGWTAFGITGWRETADVYNDGITALGSSSGIGGKWGQAGYLLSCIGCGLLKSSFLFLFSHLATLNGVSTFSLITMIPKSLHLPGCFFLSVLRGSMQNADRFSQNFLPFTCFTLVTSLCDMAWHRRPSSRMDGGWNNKNETAAGCVYDTLYDTFFF